MNRKFRRTYSNKSKGHYRNKIIPGVQWFVSFWVLNKFSNVWSIGNLTLDGPGTFLAVSSIREMQGYIKENLSSSNYQGYTPEDIEVVIISIIKMRDTKHTVAI